MAVAGGRPRADSPRYTPVANIAELTSGLQTLIGISPACVLRRPAAAGPATPAAHISVSVDGAEIPQDPTHLNGWDFVDATQTSVQVYGPACEALMSGAANRSRSLQLRPPPVNGGDRFTTRLCESGGGAAACRAARPSGRASPGRDRAGDRRSQGVVPRRLGAFGRGGGRRRGLVFGRAGARVVVGAAVRDARRPGSRRRSRGRRLSHTAGPARFAAAARSPRRSAGPSARRVGRRA